MCARRRTRHALALPGGDPHHHMAWRPAAPVDAPRELAPRRGSPCARRHCRRSHRRCRSGLAPFEHEYHPLSGALARSLRAGRASEDHLAVFDHLQGARTHPTHTPHASPRLAPGAERPLQQRPGPLARTPRRGSRVRRGQMNKTEPIRSWRRGIRPSADTAPSSTRDTKHPPSSLPPPSPPPPPPPPTPLHPRASRWPRAMYGARARASLALSRPSARQSVIQV